jgi:N-acetylglutamate synthase-like GNAT family acetyltransferase
VVSQPTIRPATEADAGAIRALIRQAQLNPRDLDWRRFLVADEGGKVIGIAQVRVHGEGTRELASVAVRRDRQGQGVGRLVSDAAIAREPTRPLYLYTEGHTVPFWEKFAFREIGDAEVPDDLLKAVRFARRLVGLYSAVFRKGFRIAVMRRDEA